MLSDELRHIGPEDAMAHAAPMSHGSGSKMLAYLLRGARNVPLAVFDPEQLLEQSVTHRLTASFMVPTMVNMLTEAAKAKGAGRDLPLRTITYGGRRCRSRSSTRRSRRSGRSSSRSTAAPRRRTRLRSSTGSPTSRRTERIRGSIGRETTFGILNVLTAG